MDEAVKETAWTSHPTHTRDDEIWDGSMGEGLHSTYGPNTNWTYHH